MYVSARDVAECTWGEKVLLHIDALLVFLKIVVVFREKVDGFQRLSGCFCKIHNGLLPIFRVM